MVLVEKLLIKQWSVIFFGQSNWYFDQLIEFLGDPEFIIQPEFNKLMSHPAISSTQ